MKKAPTVGYYDPKTKKWIPITNPKQIIPICVGMILKVGRKAVRVI